MHRLADHPEPAAGGHLTGSTGYRRVVVALMAGGLANFAVMYFVQPLLPLLVTEYGVSTSDSAHALSITTATIIIGLLAAGPLSDRIGRVRLMRWSLLASGVFGLASAFAMSWAALLTLRGLLGVTLAWFPAAALAYLREEVHPASHTKANAAYIAGTGVGGAAGRLLPGPLAALGGWTMAASVISLLTLAAGIALWLLLPPSEGFEPRPVSLRDVVLGTITAPSDAVIAGLCAAGFTAMGAFVGIYNAAAFRLQAPPFSLGHAASLVYLAYPLGIAGPTLLRRLSDRIGRGYATVVGTVVLGAAVLVVSADALAGVVTGLSLLTFGFLGTHAMLSGWVVDRAQRQGRGTAQASSAYLIAYYLGSTIAGAAATWLWQDVGWGGVEVLAGVLVLACVGAVALSARADRNPTVTVDDEASLA
jgi:MFS transporter, YNFM family, putative membrane transport protein